MSEPDLARLVAEARLAWRESRRRPVRVVLGLFVLISAGILVAPVREGDAGASLDSSSMSVAVTPAETSTMRPELVALSPLLILATIVHADQNLIVGGDFESVPQGMQGSPCHSTRLSLLPGWSSNLGWTVDRRKNDPSCFGTSCEPTHAAGGLYSISLQGSVCCGCDNNGWIMQTIPTISGRTYRLSFDYMLDDSDQLLVELNGLEQSFQWNGLLEWRSAQIDFVAVGSTVIRFASASPSGPTWNDCNACWEGCGCLLDNISVRENDCTPDVVQNGIIDAIDLAAVLSSWGTEGGKYPRADVNGDGFVDALDLAEVLSGWGPCP